MQKGALKRLFLGPARVLGSALLLWMCTGMAEDSTNAPANFRLEVSPSTSEAPASASTNWNVGLTFGAGFGVAALGSTDAHDLAIATLHVGKLLESENRFFRHLELSDELWASVCRPRNRPVPSRCGVGNGCRSSSRSRIQRGN